jgi:hypothetical protein
MLTIKQNLPTHKTMIMALIIGLILLTSGCKNAPSLGENPATDAALLTQSSSWKVSYYWDKDKEETSDFSGYSFAFEANDVFKATRGDGTAFSGQWSRTTSDGLPRLVISITGNKQMENLSDDWVLIQLSEQKIELKDDNNTHLEELHFVKE